MEYNLIPMRAIEAILIFISTALVASQTTNSSCPFGFYSTSSNTCAECLLSCSKCTNLEAPCEGCSEGFRLLPDQTECQACGFGQERCDRNQLTCQRYYRAENGQCRPICIVQNCQQCATIFTRTCVSCRAGFTLNSDFTACTPNVEARVSSQGRNLQQQPAPRTTNQTTSQPTTFQATTDPNADQRLREILNTFGGSSSTGSSPQAQPSINFNTIDPSTLISGLSTGTISNLGDIGIVAPSSISIPQGGTSTQPNFNSQNSFTGINSNTGFPTSNAGTSFSTSGSTGAGTSGSPTTGGATTNTNTGAGPSAGLTFPTNIGTNPGISLINGVTTGFGGFSSSGFTGSNGASGGSSSSGAFPDIQGPFVNNQGRQYFIVNGQTIFTGTSTSQTSTTTTPGTSSTTTTSTTVISGGSSSSSSGGSSSGTGSGTTSIFTPPIVTPPIVTPPIVTPPIVTPTGNRTNSSSTTTVTNSTTTVISTIEPITGTSTIVPGIVVVPPIVTNTTTVIGGGGSSTSTTTNNTTIVISGGNTSSVVIPPIVVPPIVTPPVVTPPNPNRICGLNEYNDPSLGCLKCGSRCATCINSADQCLDCNEQGGYSKQGWKCVTNQFIKYWMILNVPAGQNVSYLLGEGMNQFKRNFIMQYLPGYYAGSSLSVISTSWLIYDQVNNRINISGIIDKVGNRSIVEVNKTIADNFKNATTIGPLPIVSVVTEPNPNPDPVASNTTPITPVAQPTQDPIQLSSGVNPAAIIVPSIVGGLLLLGLLAALLCYCCKWCCFKAKDGAGALSGTEGLSDRNKVKTVQNIESPVDTDRKFTVNKLEGVEELVTYEPAAVPMVNTAAFGTSSVGAVNTSTISRKSMKARKVPTTTTSIATNSLNQNIYINKVGSGAQSMTVVGANQANIYDTRSKVEQITSIGHLGMDSQYKNDIASKTYIVEQVGNHHVANNKEKISTQYLNQGTTTINKEVIVNTLLPATSYASTTSYAPATNNYTSTSSRVINTTVTEAPRNYVAIEHIPMVNSTVGSSNEVRVVRNINTVQEVNVPSSGPRSRIVENVTYVTNGGNGSSYEVNNLVNQISQMNQGNSKYYYYVDGNKVYTNSSSINGYSGQLFPATNYLSNQGYSGNSNLMVHEGSTLNNGTRRLMQQSHRNMETRVASYSPKKTIIQSEGSIKTGQITKYSYKNGQLVSETMQAAELIPSANGIVSSKEIVSSSSGLANNIGFSTGNRFGSGSGLVSGNGVNSSKSIQYYYSSNEGDAASLRSQEELRNMAIRELTNKIQFHEGEVDNNYNYTRTETRTFNKPL